MPDSTDLPLRALPAAIAAAGDLGGLLLRHPIVVRLRRAAERTSREGITIPFPTRTVEIVGGGVVAER